MLRLNSLGSHGRWMRRKYSARAGCASSTVPSTLLQNLIFRMFKPEAAGVPTTVAFLRSETNGLGTRRELASRSPRTVQPAR